MKAIQNFFGGGIDTISPDTQIAEDKVPLLINGRTRFGKIEPIPKHIQDLELPPEGVTNNFQGLAAIGNVLIVFISGAAYYREDGNPSWIRMPDFIMNPDVDEYWTQTVPASYFHFVRKTTSENIRDLTSVTTDFKVAGTPSGLVVQDGLSQPWIIVYDWVNQIFTARQCHNYAQWSNVSENASDREYVPIGRQMMYHNGILFIVSKDKTRIYRSVTGRPLDFMVNVDENGNKMPTESLGGAETVSFSFDFDIITCIKALNIPTSFIYATEHNVRIVTMDFSNTIFGEPTFFISSIIAAGIVNQNSFADIIGEYAFIDKEGVISFDAVEQLNFNGRNSIFSLNVSKFLKLIKQTKPLCFTFDNYTFFNVDSTLGNILMVYDSLRKAWSAIDITDVIKLKQVAIVETTSATKAYCITRDDKLFQLFCHPTEVYLTQFRTKSFVESSTEAEHKTMFFRAMFDSTIEDGYARVIELVDEQQSQEVEQPITGAIAGIPYPVRPPVMPNNKNRVENPAYTMTKGLMGKKIAYIVEWNKKSNCIEYTMMSTTKVGLSSHKQTAKTLETLYAVNS